MPVVEIVDYCDEHYEAYRSINYAWIEEYFTIEDEDRAKLDHPQENILDKGGIIVMALLDGKAVGTCSLLKHPKGRYELSKMAVTTEAQGQGIGYKLGQHMINAAKKRGGSAIFLETNDRLAPALKLYQKLGFKPMENEPSPYARCNVQLIIEF